MKALTNYKAVKNHILSKAVVSGSKAVVSGRQEDTVRNDSSRLGSGYT